MSDGTQLVRYDAMCRAIAAAHAVDEVKDIRDKARAIEMYARQALNKEAERQATDIRLRAERKCGELLVGLKEAGMLAKGGAPYHKPTGYIVEPVDVEESRLADWKLTKRQSHDFQRLAAIPPERFEADMADPMWRPSTAGLLERQDAREREPVPQLRGDEDALWLWGVLYDFEERGLLRRDSRDVMATPMHDHMRDTFYRLAPLIAEWLGEIK